MIRTSEKPEKAIQIQKGQRYHTVQCCSLTNKQYNVRKFEMKPKINDKVFPNRCP